MAPPFFIPKYLSYYFSRPAWLEAVQKGDASLFHAQRQLTPVQQAKTITEKLRIRPDIRPCIDWCVEWLRSQPPSYQKSTKLADAYETARKLAVKEVDEQHEIPRSPFHIKYVSVCAGCFITFRMLQQYAVSGDDGMEHTDGEAELALASDALDGFGSDPDSRDLESRPAVCCAAACGAYSLRFDAVADVGVDASALQARIEREARSIGTFRYTPHRSLRACVDACVYPRLCAWIRACVRVCVLGAARACVCVCVRVCVRKCTRTVVLFACFRERMQPIRTVPQLHAWLFANHTACAAPLSQTTAAMPPMLY